ncbi:TetR/AcrR family transcriptional regulator [Streptomyces aquilus]|uniref:TetR/AcrR family transcriptional regulator n=1 Tax=Streptomyces aquilus TaxID=2548456 RepID=A0A3Q9C616_9ACTN|nr:TetR/AcrR family transcriptional regulator [Streptomyces aquilus]AZP22724.1 TetR/AcrR family transcriptional regulator [Streptomyces aquilus]
MSDNAAPRRRGPYATTPARRVQIVRAALASFAEHGFERASLRDIAARAGMTHAALLRHFSGKEELLLTALAQREKRDEEQADRILAAGSSGASVLGQILADEFADPDYLRHWLALSIAATNPAHPAHEYFARRGERLRRRLHNASTPAAPSGATLTDDDRAVMVLAMMDGLRIQTLLDPSRNPLRLMEPFMRMVITPAGSE